MTDIKKEVEAILFAAGRAVSMDEFQSLLGLKNPGLVKEAIKDLILDYREAERPLLIVEEDDGWKLTVKEGFLSLVQKVNPHTELSKTILETLAVIAWKQPALQSDVIKVRTNKAYEHISELERLGFIAKERNGRSFLVKVTQKFLDYFDLPDNKAIKEVFKDFKQVEAAVQKKVDEFEKEEERLGPEGEDAQEGIDMSGKKAKEDSDGAVGKAAEEKTIMTGEDGAIELEPYIDVPPEGHKPHTGAEVEIYNDAPPRQEKAAGTGIKAFGQDAEGSERAPAEGAEEGAEEGTVKGADTEDAEDAETGGDEASGEDEKTPEETPEAKAKRLAQELIAEDEPEEENDEDALPERDLHPKLEEFVAGSMEHIAPKGQENHSDEIAEKREGAVHDEEGARVEDRGAPVEESSADGKDKDMPVEEYPGQFDKEAQEKAAKQEGSEDPEEPVEAPDTSKTPDAPETTEETAEDQDKGA